WIYSTSAWQRADAPASLPELFRGEPGALGHRRELGPDDIRIDGGLADPGPVAAVAARDDVLAPDQLCVAADALGDQLGMLDEVRLRFEHAGDQHLALRQLDRLKHRPFVRVARVGRFERDGAGTGLEDHVDNVAERHVAMVRAFVVAPAEM